jgi:hypothetical protein
MQGFKTGYDSAADSGHGEKMPLRAVFGSDSGHKGALLSGGLVRKCLWFRIGTRMFLTVYIACLSNWIPHSPAKGCGTSRGRCLAGDVCMLRSY